jgi:hypothetical protein
MLRRTLRPRWWARAPYLPVPAPQYVEFRIQTQYGDGGHAPDRRDVVRYLEWCRDWDRGTRATTAG